MTTSGSEGAAAARDRMRLFFAAWPPEPAAAALYRYASEIATASDGRVMPAENLHVTLAFLGDIASARLKEALEAARLVVGYAHELPIEAARYRARSRLIWAEPLETPSLLAALAEALAHALTRARFTLERRPFAAHVTLIRNAGKPGKLPAPPAVCWPIDAFVLARSTPSADGSRYDIVERFSL